MYASSRASPAAIRPPQVVISSTSPSSDSAASASKVSDSSAEESADVGSGKGNDDTSLITRN